MPQATQIGWTDFTSSPIRYRDTAGKDVWGCVRVSSGCKSCYAATLAKRWKRGGGAYTAAEMATYIPYMDNRELRRLAEMKALSGKRVFMQDMTDWLGDWIPDAMVLQLVQTMRARTDVTFQMLTKRASRLWSSFGSATPAPNIWLGVSVEDRDRSARMSAIEGLAAAGWQTFISAEPLLEDISGILANYLQGWKGKIPWVIVGGESGPGFRQMESAWAIDLMWVSQRFKAPFYFKQASALRPSQPAGLYDLLDQFKEIPA